MAAGFLGVILIGFCVVTTVWDYENEVRAEEQELRKVARTEGQNLSAYFKRAEALTALLAGDRTFAQHEHDDRTLGGERADARLTSKLTAVSDLTRAVGEACLTDSSGVVHGCAVGRRPVPEDELWPDYSWTDWFKPALALEPGEVHQTRPYFSNTNFFVLANATPVRLPGGGKAIVHVETPIDSFRREAATVGSGAEVGVVDRTDDTLVFDTVRGSDAAIEGSGRGEFLPDGATPPADESYVVNGRLAVYDRVDVAPANENKWIVVVRSAAPAPSVGDSVGVQQIGLLGGGILLLLAAVAIRRYSRRATEETDRMKGDLLGLVSHELRTPLTSIIGYTELLAEMEADKLSDQGRGFLEVIERNAQRELRLVGDLLTLQQIDGGRFAIKAVETELAPIVDAAIESARPKAEAKRVELHIDLDADAVAPVDAERLGQVLDNLLSNAVKYTPEGGKAEVRLFGEGANAVIEVADTGLGIPADELDQLFERMFRASNATEMHIPGVGLGLSIVKAIVEAHGGKIAVRSTVGEGTTFRVELPGLVAAAAARGEGAATPA